MILTMDMEHVIPDSDGEPQVAVIKRALWERPRVITGDVMDTELTLADFGVDIAFS